MTFGGLNACLVLAGSILLLESVAEHRRSNRLATAQGGKSVVVATKKSYAFIKADDGFWLFLY